MITIIYNNNDKHNTSWCHYSDSYCLNSAVISVNIFIHNTSDCSRNKVILLKVFMSNNHEFCHLIWRIQVCGHMIQIKVNPNGFDWVCDYVNVLSRLCTR